MDNDSHRREAKIGDDPPGFHGRRSRKEGEAAACVLWSSVHVGFLVNERDLLSTDLAGADVP
ncbi:hypothetical protein TIFTF001_014918 [Ficus carica]|uniref:Uncharacterized protein n=1 Tax=Ficus carica TaxID=3494 RepID=A0AA88A3J6_FICCA|nr:hypothetical protein TIFTF001_014918 [Ficus carica]